MTSISDPPAEQSPPEDEPNEQLPLRRGEPYNLADRVHGDGVHSNGSDHSRDEEAESYNLAERVYRHRSPNGHSNGNGRANGQGAEEYNLAKRIRHNGHTNGNGHGQLTAADGVTAVAAVPEARSAATLPPIATAVAAPSLERRPSKKRGKFSFRTFESLNDRNFRWYFLAMLGQFASMQMQQFIRGFLVFELTGSFAALGVISLANAIPGIAFSLVGGVVADRLPKRVLLQSGQVANMIMAGVIAYLLFNNALRFEHLMVAAVVQGTSNAMTMPARQAIVPEIVGVKRLMNAVALNTAGMNLTRLVAPAVGGLLVAVVGASGVYVVMTSMYLFAILTLMKVPARPAEARLAAERGGVAVAGGARSGQRGSTGGRGAGRGGASGLGDLVDGLKYIVRTPNIRTLLIVNFLIVLVSMPYMMMLPGFAKEVLDTDSTELGILMSITGVGSLAGSLVIASLPNRNRGKLLLFGSMLLGGALLAFSASSIFWLSAAIMIVVGIGQTSRMSLSNVLIQAYVDDAYRGRVMSIYMMEFSLTMLGVFGVGILASIFGVQLVIGGTAVAVIAVASLVYLFVPRMRNMD